MPPGRIGRGAEKDVSARADPLGTSASVRIVLADTASPFWPDLLRSRLKNAAVAQRSLCFQLFTG